jgi:hypothetical protein
MPLKLNVGVSRKMGLPDYGSVGASCNLEMELDAGLLERDLDGFQARIRGAYVAAHQAVHDELARLHAPGEEKTAPSPPAATVSKPENGDRRTNSNSESNPNGKGTIAEVQSDRPRVRKPASASQVKAILAIARRQDADLVSLLRQEFDVERPEELSLRQASELIDLLKASTEA